MTGVRRVTTIVLLILFGSGWTGCGEVESRTTPRTTTRTGAQPTASAFDAPVSAEPTGEVVTADAAPVTVAAKATPLPCEVDEVLDTSCRGCHAAEPNAIAPMALQDVEDLRAPAVSDPERSVAELMLDRLHSEVAPMPPLGSRSLTPDELSVLDGFLDAGMPAGAGGCEAPLAEVEGIHYTTPEPEEIGECHRFQAHEIEAAGDATPYVAPPGEYYSCFYFDVPWPAGSQAITIRSLDTPLTHHWMLYDVNEPYAPGEMRREAPNCGQSPRGALGVYGLNQQREQHMPDGVGLALPDPGSGHGILLEVHYVNDEVDVPDQAGVEVCTAKTPRRETAGIAALGAALFLLPPGQETDVQATCTPLHDGDIHIFRSYPHMHALGTRLDTVIERAAGGSDVLIDELYDWNNQRMYDTPAVIRPGDRLVTTCHYQNMTQNFVGQGYTAEDEMCNNFIYAWPANALANLQAGGFAYPCVL